MPVDPALSAEQAAASLAERFAPPKLTVLAEDIGWLRRQLDHADTAMQRYLVRSREGCSATEWECNRDAWIAALQYVEAVARGLVESAKEKANA